MGREVCAHRIKSDEVPIKKRFSQFFLIKSSRQAKIPVVVGLCYTSYCCKKIEQIRFHVRQAAFTQNGTSYSEPTLPLLSNTGRKKRTSSIWISPAIKDCGRYFQQFLLGWQVGSIVKGFKLNRKHNQLIS